MESVFSESHFTMAWPVLRFWMEKSPDMKGKCECTAQIIAHSRKSWEGVRNKYKIPEYRKMPQIFRLATSARPNQLKISTIFGRRRGKMAVMSGFIWLMIESGSRLW
jgi:hypothetical protein